MHIDENMSKEDADALIEAEFERASREEINEVAKETRERILMERIRPLLSNPESVPVHSTVTVMVYEDFGANAKKPSQRVKKWVIHPFTLEAGKVLKNVSVSDGTLLCSLEKEQSDPYHMLRISISDELIEALQSKNS